MPRRSPWADILDESSEGEVEPLPAVAAFPSLSSAGPALADGRFMVSDASLGPLGLGGRVDK